MSKDAVVNLGKPSGLEFLGIRDDWDDLIARLDRIEAKLDAVIDTLDKRG